MSRFEPASPWTFTPRDMAAGEDLYATGADLEPGTLLDAYRSGVFPMGIGGGGAPPIGWWSPDPRGVLLHGDLRVSRSLRKSARRMRVEVDTDFEQVVDRCADPTREGAWITPQIRAAYLRLFEWGLAHSVEAWIGDRLVGGLYGVSIGGLFAGESMFHTETDASKVALLGLVERVYDSEDATERIIDVQWQTPHLASLGVRAISRDDYLDRLERALGAGRPAALAELGEARFARKRASG